MNLTPDRPRARAVAGIHLLLLSLAALVAGCGSGGPSTESAPPPAAVCNPNDPATAAECGTLLIGLTDADGDFLSYAVDVVSLKLERADGTVVETLPNSTRIDFTEYVDLTEFVTAASVPPGVYVAGIVTLDYADAEVYVEAGGAAKEAVVVDANGEPLGRAELTIRLSDQNRLVIARGRLALLTADFDLAASHVVDTAPTPVIATSEPFIVAELEPVDSKDFRLRGLFVEANPAELYYTAAIRPFHAFSGDFGRARVHVTETTEFEVDGVPALGAEGLRALEAAGAGTYTVALGTLDVAERRFTARVVLAGSSVPGIDDDAVSGNVISRNGNEFTVRGGTVFRPGQRPFFRGDVTVTVGPDTRVVKTGFDGDPGIDAISIGQRVLVRGELSTSDSGLRLDATGGAVRLFVTHLSGVVNTIVPGQLDIELAAIDRRRVAVFDFTGTGTSEDVDADPANYEVATGSLSLTEQAVDRPVAVYGFPSAFGAAPPDFEGRTVVDFSDVRSTLGIGWGASGTAAPFLAIGQDGLLLDNANPDIGERHYIVQGPLVIDLTTLDSGTLIVPRESGRRLFVVKTNDSLRLYVDFAEFADAVTNSLGAGALARSMYAYGHYDGDANVFTAYKLGIHLLEP